MCTTLEVIAGEVANDRTSRINRAMRSSWNREKGRNAVPIRGGGRKDGWLGRGGSNANGGHSLPPNCSWEFMPLGNSPFGKRTSCWSPGSCSPLHSSVCATVHLTAIRPETVSIIGKCPLNLIPPTKSQTYTAIFEATFPPLPNPLQSVVSLFLKNESQFIYFIWMGWVPMST